jgi:hypothetical protein
LEDAGLGNARATAVSVLERNPTANP